MSELENLVKYYHEKKLAHAYLISTNNMQKCYQVLLNTIKNIFCVNDFSLNCKKCSLCHLIDIQNLPSLKVIEPDGSFIKKNQILELKNLFSKDSLYTKENIYIIKNAEKMNKESANTMLKFLEEPDGNVIGFFITNNKDNVLLTIQSRCQLIEANFKNNLFEEFDLTEEVYSEYSNILKEYLEEIENNNNKELILINRKIFIDSDKDKINKIFQMMLSVYKNELNSRYIAVEKNSEYSFLSKFSINNLKKKINLIIGILKEINYNVVIDLLLDKFVIEMDGINSEGL